MDNYPQLDLDVANSDLLIKLTSYEYATKLYNAMCCNDWVKEGYNYNDKEPWHVPMRVSSLITSSFYRGSDLVANYDDFTETGNEGIVDEEIAQDLYELGWTIK